MNYLVNHRESLRRFPEDGRLRLDNNLSELELRRQNCRLNCRDRSIIDPRRRLAQSHFDGSSERDQARLVARRELHMCLNCTLFVLCHDQSALQSKQGRRSIQRSRLR